MEAFASTVLERLFATSLQTAALTALVWMICRSLPRLSPASQCWLWWLVGLQALLGLILSPVELQWLPHAKPVVPAADPVWMQWQGPAFSDTTAAPYVADGAATNPVAQDHVLTLQTLLLLFWGCGVAVMCSLTLHGWLRTRQILGRSAACGDDSLLHAMSGAAQSLDLRTAPALHVSRDIDSPLLVASALRPVLLLPADHSLDRKELEMVFSHELAHVSRGDLWWGLLPTLARNLLFFHPFALLAAREYAITREAACDAVAVRCSRQSRRDYGRLLVQLGTATRPAGAIPVASSTFRALKWRLTLLRTSSFLPWSGSLMVVTLVAAVGVLPLRLVAAASPATSATVAADMTPDRKAPEIAPSRPDIDPGNQAGSTPRAIKVAQAAPASNAKSGSVANLRISKIDFRRSSESPASGSLVIDLSDSRIPVNLRREGDRVLVDFVGADLAPEYQKSYYVRDFGTPVTDFSATRTADGARITITAAGDFEPVTHQVDNRLVIDIQARNLPAACAAARAWCNDSRTLFTNGTGSANPVYTGARMTANFQDVAIRTLLQLIGSIGNVNIIVSNSVSGNTAARFESVPWDQALDVVLQNNGLDKQVVGNAIVVAPRDELARQTAIRQAFAMDAVIDDRPGSPTLGKPICRITRDGMPESGAPNSPPGSTEILRQLATGCQPLNVFGAAVGATANAAAATQPAHDDYKLAIGDELQILVAQNPELGATVTVRPDGKVSTPLVDDRVAAGRTPSQLARDIETVLARFVRAPRVTVILKSTGVSSPLGNFNFSIGKSFGEASNASTLAEARMQLDLLRQRYNDNHPQVKSLQDQIDRLMQQAAEQR